MFQELMDNYTAMEECIGEAQKNVADLDTDQIRRQGEVEASDAARRQARELGVDITEIEGTGSEGRVIVDDVKNAAEAAGNGTAQQAQDAAGQAAGQAQQAAGQVAGQAQQATGQAGGEAKEIDATDAARREAEERGIDLSQVKGTGTDGRIIISDVTEIDDQAEAGAGPAGQATGQAQQAAGQATEQAGQVAGQAQDAAGGAAQQAQDTAGQAADQAQ
ncbi:MAG: E3 binding domain-containing protein, partial [Rubrobacteraceae bacterium]